MKWSSEAEEAMRKVPFFVRKKVRKKIEQYVQDEGRHRVTLADTKAAKKQFLATLSNEIKGYQADRCFGSSGCPHAANDCGKVLERAEALLENENILDFLKQHVKGDLKFHHEFRLTAADCPNACSQPQIKDFGIIGAVKPKITDEPCIGCEACVHACPDHAISLIHPSGTAGTSHRDLNEKNRKEAGTSNELYEHSKPFIDTDACLVCGKCIKVCPTGTLQEEKRGFRVMLGGRLGRHPRLAIPLPKIYTEDEVIEILKRVLAFYKENSTEGARFSKIFDAADLKRLLNASSPNEDHG